MRSTLRLYHLVVSFAPDYDVQSYELNAKFETMKARCEHLHSRLPEATIRLYSRTGVCLLSYDGRPHLPANCSCRKLYVS